MTLANVDEFVEKAKKAELLLYGSLMNQANYAINFAEKNGYTKVKRFWLVCMHRLTKMSATGSYRKAQIAEDYLYIRKKYPVKIG